MTDDSELVPIRAPIGPAVGTPRLEPPKRRGPPNRLVDDDDSDACVVDDVKAVDCVTGCSDGTD